MNKVTATVTILILLSICVSAQSDCVENCLDCQADQCIFCRNGFEKNVYGECIENLIDKCAFYSAQNTCFVCQQTYRLEGFTQCVKMYDGCLSGIEDQCFDCGYGTRLQDGKCMGPANCEVPSDTCQKCRNGYELKNNVCHDISPGCAQVNELTGICQSCKVGYFMSGLQCFEEKYNNPRCYILLDQEKCLVCKDGSILEQGVCLSSPENEQIRIGAKKLEDFKFVPLNIFTSFEDSSFGNSEFGGSTVFGSNTGSTGFDNTGFGNTGSTNFGSNTGSTGFDNTGFGNTGTTNFGSTTGSTGFENTGFDNTDFDNTGSASFGSNTASTGFENTGNTGFDNTGLQPVAIERCLVYDPQNPSKCMVCENFYFPFENLCKQVSEACDQYNPQDGSCTSCKYGLSLENGECIDNNCIKIVNLVCTQCIDLFKVNSRGYCVRSDPNCAVENNGLCFQCNEGYYVNNLGSCKLLPPFCVVANPLDGSCLDCIQGYQITVPGQPCVPRPTIPNCEVINPQNSNACLICKERYFPQGSGCQKVSELCGGYNPQNGNCLSCLNPELQLINGKCSDPNCLVPSGATCSQCKPNFTFDSNAKICKFTDPNCANLITTACLTCKASFYPGSTGICEPIPQCQPNFLFNLNRKKCVYSDVNCLNPSETTCEQCQVGFYLGATGPCQRIPTCQANSVFDFVKLRCIFQDSNCASLSDVACLQCKTGFYTSASGKCQALPANCAQAFPTGQCQTCLNGFNLTNGICSANTFTIANCVSVDLVQRICTRCAVGYYPVGQACAFLPDNCVNASNGRCTKCAANYEVTTTGACSRVIYTIPNCLQIDEVNKFCRLCSDRYYAVGNSCAAVSPDCNTYNRQTGACETCYPGYVVSGTACVIQTTPTPTPNPNNGGIINTDPNCLNYSSGMCQMCSSRYYYSSADRKCVPVNPLCKEYNSMGECTSCYPGYITQSGKCIITLSSDPNCKTPANGRCSECYAGFFYSSIDARCRRINPLCKTSNLTNGFCTSCYPGYNLNAGNGNCEVFFKDPNCQQFNGNDCVRCSNRFYVNSGRCQPVNPLCKSYSESNGNCETCYPGYSISNGKCVVGVSGTTEANCKVFNNGACEECFTGYFLSAQRKCMQINPLCKTSDPLTGYCTSCYPGYEIALGNCTINLAKDENCKTFDISNRNFCVECYPGYLPISGKCQVQNPLCKTINKLSGACVTCWPGYSISGANCTVQTAVSSASSDIYCIESSNGACRRCSNGYYVSPETNLCSQLNPLCKTHNMTNGACLTCYPGYVVSERKCVIQAFLSIPNCLDITGGSCSKCIEGFYLKSDKSCEHIPLTCQTYNHSLNRCEKCIFGHFLQNNECIYPALYDPYCIYYESAYCSRCQPGYFVNNFICQEVQAECSDFDYDSKVCRACLNGKVPQGYSCL